MADLFLDNPLVHDFIIANTTSNQHFSLTAGSQNIAPGAVGNLRSFDVDFCEFKYKYFYQPTVRDWFDLGYLTAIPVYGSSALVCSWEPAVVVSGGGSGGGTTIINDGMVKVTQFDDAETYLNDAIDVQSPLTKQIVSSPLVGGGLDQQLKIGINLSALGQVGSFYFYDYAVVSTDNSPTVMASETLTVGSYLWTIHINIVCTAGINAGKRASLVRTLSADSSGTIIQNYLLESDHTRRPVPWNFSVETAGNVMTFKVTGTSGDTVQWFASIIKNKLAL